MATDLVSAADETGVGEINKYDFITPSHAVFKAEKGLNAKMVSAISEMKQEPAWMRDFRLRSLKIFESKPMPRWGGSKRGWTTWTTAAVDDERKSRRRAGRSWCKGRAGSRCSRLSLRAPTACVSSRRRRARRRRRV